MVFRGRVIDARTALPVADVAVALTSSGDTIGLARSDSAGRFATLTSAAGAVVVHFVRLGYRADSLTASIGNELPLRVAMNPIDDATTLAAVVVRDSKNDFELRARHSGAGVFINEADIETRKPNVTSDLLRTVSGIAIDASGASVRVISLRADRPKLSNAPVAPNAVEDETLPGRSPEGGAKKCSVRIAVDGQLMPKDYSIDLIRPSEIRGIEVYQGAAGIPIAFSTVQADAPCGLVMIWIKGHAPGRR